LDRTESRGAFARLLVDATPRRSTRASCRASPRIRGELGQRVESAPPARNKQWLGAGARRLRAWQWGPRHPGRARAHLPPLDRPLRFPFGNGGKRRVALVPRFTHRSLG
jgi:hypothetical protein